MNRLARWALRALPFAVATLILGWWGVPLVAAIWGFTREPEDVGIFAAAGGAALAWLLLLGFQALNSPVWGLAAVLGDILSLTAIGMLVVTIVFPAAVTASVTGAAREVRRGIS